MDPISASVKNPVAVLVGVILVVLFGLLGLANLPYQLTPTVTEPEISVTTSWPGATPYEVERDIVEEQEDVLKGIPGLKEMESEAFNGFSQVTLTFEIGTDVDAALLRVSNKLNEVPEYPDTADRPIITATGANTSPVIWLILKSLPGNPRPAPTYRTFFEDEVRQYLERVKGVADLFIGGGAESEMQVVIEPEKLAAHNLTIQDVIRALSSENVSVAAGTLGVGRRDYRIRSVAEFRSAREIEEAVLLSDGARRVRVKDVGHAAPGFEKLEAAMLHDGEPGIAIGIKPEPGANVIRLTDDCEAVVNALNAGKLAEAGVKLQWAYDERPYINGAIDLVKENILIGAVLAAVVLLLFLRSLSATFIVSASIPVSIIGTFLFMDLFGRNLNVVSMAGISFAVGMLVDNAIVVLENIDRHRLMGKSGPRAAYDGAKEVWGAVLASTLTTVAVFLPVVFVREEAGQLFKDIAIAVTCSISLSLFVSVLVIPMLGARLFGRKKPQAARFAWLDTAGGALSGLIMRGVAWCTRSTATRLATVVLFTGLSIGATWAFFPKMEYLPQGNRNLVLTIFVPPPGLSVAEREEIGRYAFARAKPHYGRDEGGVPGIREMFYVGADRFMIMGAIATSDDNAAGLVPFFSGIVREIPAMYGVSLQASIFETGLGEGRVISLDFSGPDLNRLIAAAGTAFGKTRAAIPGAQIRPLPSLELQYPEVRFLPDRDRLRASGMTSEEFGTNLDVLMDGRKVSEYKEEGRKTIDLVLKAGETDIPDPEALARAMVATPGGRVVPVSQLATVQRAHGLNQIRHLERRRTVTLQITPPEAVPLQQAMETVQNDIVPGLRQAGLLDGIDVSLSGAADKLTQTRQALQDNFLLACVITYLLMAALFGNFIYPIIIMFTVPLAGAGGFVGLKLENLFIAPQPLDIVTMLGFIILIGVVVNNAILIVHQSLNYVRHEGLEFREAVLTATRTRLRPIYMSALTSVFGMLPLAVMPGPGSELYRGLGAVVLGGLALSTFFTVFLIPAMLMFFSRMETPGSHAGAGDGLGPDAGAGPGEGKPA